MLGRRIAVMKEGAIQQVAEPTVVYRHPANLFVAAFIGFPAMNCFEGRIAPRGKALLFEEQGPANAAARGGLALALNGPMAERMQAWADRPVILGIRPEHIARSMSAPGAPQAQTVEAVVEVVQPMGAESYLVLAGAGRSFLARVPASDPARPLERVRLVFDIAQAHFFDAITQRAIGTGMADVQDQNGPREN